MAAKWNDTPLKLAITMGDPAGIGPEIIIRLFEDARFPSNILPFVVGDLVHLQRMARNIGSKLLVKPVESAAQLQHPVSGEPLLLQVLPPEDFSFPASVTPGQISGDCGAAAWACVKHSVRLIQSGQAHAIVTAPLHKEALKAAGCPYPGHTEMLAALAGNAKVAMLLVGGGLRVALATIHEPIARVPSLLSAELILDRLRILHRFIPWFGLNTREGSSPRQKNPCIPRIGVTGLNPHAGEGGMFGDEERRIIAPAIARACAEGMDAVGPLPADTAFFFHREGAYDAILAMYHDQALIPVKTLDFHGGVNVTMGLPFIRTSVDHGTGFDIAGRGIAKPDSLRAAVSLAATLALNRLGTES